MTCKRDSRLLPSLRWHNVVRLSVRPSVRLWRFWWIVITQVCGKVACCSTKAAISLKRVKIEKTYWMPMNSPTLFQTAYRTILNLYGLLPQVWGFVTPTENSNRKLLENECKWRNSVWKAYIWGNMELGTARIFLATGIVYTLYIISWMGKATDFKFCKHIHILESIGSSEQKSMKFFWEKYPLA